METHLEQAVDDLPTNIGICIATLSNSELNYSDCRKFLNHHTYMFIRGFLGGLLFWSK